MTFRTMIIWLGFIGMAVAIGAGLPPTTPVRGGAAHPMPRPTIPVPRLQLKIGAAPKPEYQTAGHTYKIDSRQPGVTAVRSMAPKSYEPVTRSRSVNAFYREQLAKDVISKDKLNKLNVGPFRHEFVWWAWHHWGLYDRAWWAWNNYAYFDAMLWQEWMLDQDFAQTVAQFDAAHKARILGLIPDAYAATAPENIYNDVYIDAVYNPTPTPPSIVVDSTASVQLSNLLEGSPRLFGKKSLAIGTLNDRVRRFQFISVPAEFDPTYQIDVKRDGDLYVFGPSITPKNEAFGEDAGKWVPVSNQVTGPGIQVVYQRQVKTGEKIHLHGVEWSIASEQIELFSPASPAAQAASRHVLRDLEQMTNNKSEFVLNNPSLGDYIQEAHDVAGQLITLNNNVNDDAVADCRYELAHLQKLSEAELGQTSDPQIAKAGKDFVRRIQSLGESLNEVDGSGDPNVVGEMPGLAAAAPAIVGSWDFYRDGAQRGTDVYSSDGSCTATRFGGTPTSGHWHLEDGSTIVNWDSGYKYIWTDFVGISEASGEAYPVKGIKFPITIKRSAKGPEAGNGDSPHADAILPLHSQWTGTYSHTNGNPPDPIEQDAAGTVTGCADGSATMELKLADVPWRFTLTNKDEKISIKSIEAMSDDAISTGVRFDNIDISGMLATVDGHETISLSGTMDISTNKDGQRKTHSSNVVMHLSQSVSAGPQTRADAGSGVWANLLAPEHIGEWYTEIPNAPVFTPGADGTVSLNRVGYEWGTNIADVRLRATVPQTDGKIFGLYLRGEKNSDSSKPNFFAMGQNPCYSAGYDGSVFAINVRTDANTIIRLATAPSKVAQGTPFVMEFSAIGDQLALSVDGSEVLRVTDKRLQQGAVGIGGWKGSWVVKDVQVQVTVLGQWDFRNPNGWNAVLTVKSDGTCTAGRADGTGNLVNGHWETRGESIVATWDNGVTGTWKVGGSSDELSISNINNGVEQYIDAKRRTGN